MDGDVQPWAAGSRRRSLGLWVVMTRPGVWDISPRRSQAQTRWRRGGSARGVPIGWEHGRGWLGFVFYGRVSTEDYQDPVTSRARQRDQAAALGAGHGRPQAADQRRHLQAPQGRPPPQAMPRVRDGKRGTTLSPARSARTGYGDDYPGDEDCLDTQEDPQEDVVRLPGLVLTLTLGPDNHSTECLLVALGSLLARLLIDLAVTVLDRVVKRAAHDVPPCCGDSVGSYFRLFIPD